MTQIEALIATLALELPVVVAGGRYLSVPAWRAVAAGVVASLLSHPFAWALVQLSPPDLLVLWWLAVEGGVILFEAITLKCVLRVRWVAAVAVAIVANGLSAAVGWFWA